MYLFMSDMTRETYTWGGDRKFEQINYIRSGDRLKTILYYKDDAADEDWTIVPTPIGTIRKDEG